MIFDHAITGPAAWTRTDIDPASIRVFFDSDAQRELLATARALRQQPVPMLALRGDSFDLPVCRAVMARVKKILNDGPRFAVLSGLPIDELTIDEAKSLYWLLSAMLMRPVAQKLDGTMIYDVHDTGKQALPGSGVRPDKTNIELHFHNDNSYNASMPEIVGLLCVRAARSGGRSLVTSFYSVHNALRERHRELLPRLYQPFFFDRQREYHDGEIDTFHAPVFTTDGERLNARLSLHQIRGGYALRAQHGDKGMDNETTAAVEALAEVFKDTSLQYDFMLERGDIQYVANREVGHRRTMFEDHDDPDQRRLLVRLWLRNQGAQGYMG